VKSLSIKTTFFLLMLLALFLTSSLAFAQGDAQVYVQPVDTTAGTLTVDVIAENVTDLYGAEFQLKYDPAVLSVQDLDAGQDGAQIQTGSLLPADQGFVVANKVEEAQGTIVFAMTLLNPAPPVSGNGPLARVKFNVLQSGLTTIDVEHAKLVAANLQTIPSQTNPLTIEVSLPATAAPPPAADSGFPWWIVGIVVMVLGVVVLAGLIVIGGGSKSKSVAPVTSQRPVRQQQQSARPSGSRPSAFKQQQTTPPSDLAQKPQQFQ
jgi:hypothetical protein